MNAYTVDIAIPWWMALCSLALAVGVSFWAYGRPFPTLSARQRLLLGILRFLALGSLILALWQPVIGMFTSHREPPLLAVLLDNSASMRLRDASGPRDEQYRRALGYLSELLSSPSVRLLRFDARLRPLERWSPDSLTLDGPATDLAQAFRWVSSQAQRSNIAAVLLLSDGVATTGESPLPEAEALGRPVVTVLIGDTTALPDLAVHTVLVNERIPLGSATAVHAVLSAEALPEQQLQVEFWEDGRRLSTQALRISPAQRFYTVSFRYQPQTEGIHQLQVRVNPVPGEVSLRNNEARAVVEAVSLRHRIVLFAGSPSPDLAFLRRELQRNPLLELSTFIHKDASSFYEGAPPPSLLAQADAVILLDFPLRSTPEAVLSSIAGALARGCAAAVLFGPQTDWTKLRLLEPWLPITQPPTSTVQEVLATFSPTPSGALHALLRSTAEQGAQAWHTLPPIFALRNAALPKPTAELLAVGVSGTQREPLVVVQQHPVRSVALLGYGLYRWKLIGYAAEQMRQTTPPVDYLATFVTSTVQWLLEPKTLERRVRIRPLRRFYAAGEPVHIWASVTDAAGNPVEAAVVRLRVTSSDGEVRQLVLSPAEAGIYRGQLPGLPAGQYTFTGEAIRGEQLLGRDYGLFSVGDVSLEERSLRADAELLRTIAQRTGGAFFTADHIHEVESWIARLPNWRPIVTTLTRELRLWHSLWLLLLALVSLSVEWTLRRRWELL